jgi:beta-phosphoglucomutase
LAVTNPGQFGVIFDVDGVLVDSAAPHWRSWQVLAFERGQILSETQFTAAFGRQNHDVISMLFGDVSTAQMPAMADRKEAIYRDLIRHQPPIVSGAVDLVQALSAGGVRMAVGSSAPRANIDLVLSAMGVTDLVNVIISAEDVTRGKPDPQVFTLACERLSLPAECCVVIEDAPVGIQAARAAGTRTVAVLMHHPAYAFHGTDLVVERLADLSVARLRSLAAQDSR